MSVKDQIEQLKQKLDCLAVASPEGLAVVERSINTQLQAAGASRASLSASDLKACRIAGVDPDAHAAKLARRRADEALIASLPPETRKSLQQFAGSDISALATHYREREASWARQEKARADRQEFDRATTLSRGGR